ncbi:MAG: protein phosphatase 2C domain-containing protein [Planctomycetaceae bacterium]
MNNDLSRPRLQMAGLTHVGQVRTSNQDNYLIADMRRLLNVCDSSVIDMDGRSMVAQQPGELLIVADGMGGYAHGATASQIAIRQMASCVSMLMEDFLVIDPNDDEEFREALRAAPEQIRKRLQVEGRMNQEKVQMGTTLTVTYVVWPYFYVLHIGDSACYRLRDGSLSRMTRDHTVAQAMMDSGVPEDEIRNSQFHHMLWNSLSAAVSSEPEPEPDLFRHELRPGDSLLLCSDGLTRHLSLTQVESIMNTGHSPEDQCEQLITAANNGGGRDNITAVIANFQAPPSAADTCGEDSVYEVLSRLSDTEIAF